MSQSIVLLTSGSHDDYTVRALCSSEEAAKQLAITAGAAGAAWALRTWGDGTSYWTVEEWALDQLNGVQAPHVIEGVLRGQMQS